MDDGLRELLRRGDYDGTRDWVVAASPAELRAASREVARLRRVLLAARGRAGRGVAAGGL